MARPLQIDMENGLYHVTSRAWERQGIVCDIGIADAGRRVGLGGLPVVPVARGRR
jgi:hypothetical protein